MHFLAGKGMIGASEWIKTAASSPFDPDLQFGLRYRGERLEQEIPRFMIILSNASSTQQTRLHNGCLLKP